ncbi:Ataxin-3, putative [Pediculus humanus corporis]|uniref:ubiquitinyl hydrolase 1 n=1 Tax=Pediculus humanus subsp. corporis TaxID=121224 RepID=E0VEC5_PEDHC|nr:Ataxin-3, putative [Pediculus humanus corporis]EEB11731.1 Ataxin-3, putative [Pediculus humanus corporis]
MLDVMIFQAESKMNFFLTCVTFFKYPFDIERANNYVIKTNMESIYFEKQEGSLCAQHCLNALLQGPYFTAVDLAMHAQNLDDEERIRMAESGIDSIEYRNFLEQPSGNMDDSGYFSVQVISSCLSVWGLELVRYGSTEKKALEAKQNPELMKAYICNYKDHWFTVRKLAHQWFNLNSLSSGPKLISNTYLGMFLAQLQQEGYSIFVVLGDFPQCEADLVLKVKPVSQTNVDNPGPSTKNSGHQIKPFQGVGYQLGTSNQVKPYDSNDDLQRALQLSLTAEDNQTEDVEMKRAIELSLRATTSSHSLGNESNEKQKTKK